MINKTLQLSLIVNALLIGGVVFLWTERPSVTLPVAPVISHENINAPVPGAVTSPAPVAPAPLRWTRLYSRDYHIYVKNLRAIGCPEPSVRAIVTADVDSVYQLIETHLEQKLDALAQAPLSHQSMTASSEQQLRDALQKLPAEEDAKIADLLGLKPAAPALVAAANAGGAHPVPMPLVMQDIDVSALGLSPAQQQQVASIRQDFLNPAGGTNQDLSDPASLARWQQAQAEADSLLMAFLGNDAYTRYEVAAHQSMLEQIEAAQR